MQLQISFTIAMSMKYLTITLRILTQIMIYNGIKEESGDFRRLCRQAPYPEIRQNFQLRIILLAFLPYIFHFYKKLNKSSDLATVLAYGEKLYIRLILVLVIKIINFTNYDAFGVFGLLLMLFWELLLIVLAFGVDRFHFYATEVAELLFVDLLANIFYISELTRTVCFQYGLFYFYLNMLVTCVSIAQGFAYKHNRVNSLFTKQDGYRMLMLTCIYLVVFGASALHQSDWKYATSVLAPLPIFIFGMKTFKANQYVKALFLLFGYSIVCLAITKSFKQ